MRKRLYCLTLATILTVLTACGGSSDSPTTSEPTKVEATPTEETVVEPIEEDTTPTEVPVEEVMPTEAIVNAENTIDGVDFTPFIKNEDFDEVLKNADFQETRLIFFDYSDNGRRRAKFEDEGYAVLKNGETYHRRFDDHVFCASLYSPKEISIASIEYDGGMTNVIEKGASEDAVQNRIWSEDLLKYDGGTMSKEIKIKYEDGTEETFTFTVTDQ